VQAFLDRHGALAPRDDERLDRIRPDPNVLLAIIFMLTMKRQTTLARQTALQIAAVSRRPLPFSCTQSAQLPAAGKLRRNCNAVLKI
jgi:hypothetical protein